MVFYECLINTKPFTRKLYCVQIFNIKNERKDSLFLKAALKLLRDVPALTNRFRLFIFHAPFAVQSFFILYISCNKYKKILVFTLLLYHTSTSLLIQISAV